MAKILDVSHHQTPEMFNWTALKKEVDGLIIRVQFGSNLVDKQYKRFISKAKEYNIPFGLYAFGMFVSVNDARIEARDFLSRGDKEAKFWVLDVEKETISACGTKNLAAASQAFIDTLKASGKKTGFYYEHQYIGKYGLDNVKADFRWIPRYGSNNGAKQTHYKPKISCHLWQYTSVGLAGNGKPVDLSDLNGDKPISYFFGSSSNAISATVQDVAPFMPKPQFKSQKPIRLWRTGTRIKVYKYNSYWYRAYVDGKEGFIYHSFLKNLSRPDSKGRISATVHAFAIFWDNQDLRGGQILTYKPGTDLKHYPEKIGLKSAYFTKQKKVFYTPNYWLK
ncbi:GH25 family lysozyme [Listeria aquatica]|uniref:GH25 family lysozyme n=1 Tax=Listeria aquatica TaxID=1494960 RepID=UPI0031F5A444